MLHIYNSLHNRKEKFTPIEPNKIRMYVCGMTVYDYCHLGHARVMVVFDMVYRYLQVAGYDVTYVRNITDIDDKIIKRAIENNEPFTELTTRFIDAMHEDETALGVLSPTAEPRATGNIPEMLAMIETLIAKDYAYVGSNNDVYYAVAKFEGYGKLSGRKLEDLRAGERIAVDQVKRDPLDFVLWKAAKADEPAWNSPWGRGRPGWHIECSAMAQKLLGDRFDIHGGGHDLQFPHHENEIAQTEACTGHQSVNYWMHNGFIRTNDEKMSKSLGNFSTIRDVLKEHKPEAIRYFMLSTHYRKPLNYDLHPLQSAKNSLDKLYNCLKSNIDSSPLENSNEEKDFIAAMNDDFNTSKAISILYELMHRNNEEKDPQIRAQIIALMKKLGGVLGLLQQSPEDWFKGQSNTDGINDADIEALIRQRAEARANKDWAACDGIRDELKAKGVVLEDSAGGTSWRRG